MRLHTLFTVLVLMSFTAGAAIDTRQFNSVAQEQQYRELTEQLRCPKCQNNSIADSNAIIAADMRTKVYQLMLQGQTKRQIIDYMVARYGNFVTYEPPLNPLTLMLWFGPLLAVVIGGLAVILQAMRRGSGTESLSSDERRRLKQLLDKPDGKQS
ncbi:cytochrome c-type biogenesis protein [Sodalis sp. dw_96]|uniref:cytochrome c-type biogenesis protein n=1 Tax=Sodalis sp. dw_96 TaxID=2719794 RepID=UPI001BD63643|nr:cytochrome c-type biogenesis protein [Sodalis sp. dw_96]